MHKRCGPPEGRKLGFWDVINRGLGLDNPPLINYPALAFVRKHRSSLRPVGPDDIVLRFEPRQVDAGYNAFPKYASLFKRLVLQAWNRRAGSRGSSLFPGFDKTCGRRYNPRPSANQSVRV